MEPMQILAQLVRFRSVSAHSNLDLVRWIREYLAGHGVRSAVIEDGSGAKANLVATIGPPVPGGVMLSGHTDVVPTTNQVWLTDPFTLASKNGRLYGRGTCDMKGFMSVVLAAVPRMQAAKLARPIHLAFSYDEEVGCFGVPSLIKAVQHQFAPVRIVIVGEPTNMAIVDRHKGAFVETVEFRGLGGHSGKPALGVNAISYAAQFASRLAGLVNDGLAIADPGDEMHNTFNIARISGGTAHNIIPDRCTVEWSLRCAPAQDPAEVIARVHNSIENLGAAMKDSNAQCGTQTSTVLNIPPLRPVADSPAVNLCRNLTGCNATISADYGTEAGLFQEAGYSVAVCGPGSIEQAHGANEYIEEAQLQACEQFIARLVETLAA